MHGRFAWPAGWGPAGLRQRLAGSLILDADDRPFLASAGIVFAVMVLAYLSLLRIDGYYFADDNFKKISGFPAFLHLNRYLAEYLLRGLGFSEHAFDYSPLLQLACLACMALAAVTLVKIVAGRLTLFPVIMSAVLAVYPLFYENMAYTYDSAFMGLSVLASLLPFLFVADTLVFALVSVIGLLVMMTTYQLSSGVYLVGLAALAWRMAGAGTHAGRAVLKIAGVALGSWVLAMVLYRVLLHREYHGYISTDMLAWPDLLPGVLGNLRAYLDMFIEFIGYNWVLYFTGLLLMLLLLRHAWPVPRLLVTALLLAAMLALAPGLPLLLQDLVFAPRYMMGFNVVLAVVVIGLAHRASWALKSVLGVFLVGLVGLTAVYGNAMGDQWVYDRFRIHMAVAETGKHIGYPYRLAVEGSPGRAATFDAQSVQYPLIRMLSRSSFERFGHKALFERFMLLQEGDVSACQGTEHTLVDDRFTRLDRQGDCYRLRFKDPQQEGDVRVVDELLWQLDHAPRLAIPLARNGPFQVFQRGSRLVYLLRPCDAVAMQAPVFLHVYLADPPGLPNRRLFRVFQNLDFEMQGEGLHTRGDACLHVANLPGRRLRRLVTGQFNENGRLWVEQHEFSE
ncbi:glucosyltransferase domain-containing protein [Castellaniella sp.]|uniref:glucosyltransferase domain-containing protein n=1 Tax=Castellaniella sp. TaxID=1955812 RepID=UPI0035605B1A